ncbi:MAG: hypothetical protein ACI87N_000477, partial [Flavobacteriales bacterium]
ARNRKYVGFWRLGGKWGKTYLLDYRKNIKIYFRLK